MAPTRSVVSYDAQPNPESNNKIRKLGSPGYHRNLAIERILRAKGRVARSINGDAFSPTIREDVVAEIREHFAGKINGVIWALAAPRVPKIHAPGRRCPALSSHCSAPVASKRFRVAMNAPTPHPPFPKWNFTQDRPRKRLPPCLSWAVAWSNNGSKPYWPPTCLAQGCRLLTISYRGNPLNADVYRHGSHWLWRKPI